MHPFLSLQLFYFLFIFPRCRAMLYATVLNCTVLALAAEVSEDKTYAKHGGQIVRKFFLDKATFMRPNLHYAHTRQNKDGSLKVHYGGYIDTACLILAVDAWRLLQRQGGLSASDVSNLRAWAGDYLQFLLEVGSLWPRQVSQTPYRYKHARTLSLFLKKTREKVRETSALVLLASSKPL